MARLWAFVSVSLVLIAAASAQSCTRGKAANIALNKPSFQSSNYRSTAYTAKTANDGNSNTDLNKGKSCTHTKLDTNPWWYVDLGSTKSIGTVVLTNRGDCCGFRLNSVNIRIGDEPSTDGGYTSSVTKRTNANPSIRGSPFSGAVPQGGRRAYFANGMRGRYVYIRVERRTYMTLCEVEVTEYCPEPCQNVALNQPTSQSSTGWGGYADQAVDGNEEPIYGARSCTHTNSETNPWWKVDLGVSRKVSVVRVTNRGDCCTTRLNGFEIRLGNSATSGYAVCNNGDNEKTIGGGQTAEFICDGLGDKAVTQNVFIYLPGTRKILTLCEVEVYENCSRTCNNVALKKVTKQIDMGWGGVSSRAVDGNTNGQFGGKSCSHTLNNGIPNWWYVDLGREYQVASVSIANRKDCCYTAYKNIQITVGNQLANFGRYNPTCRWPKNQRPTGITKYPCANNRGRYTSIIEWNKVPLVLCEVQVCGFPLPNSALGKAAWMSSTDGTKSAYFAIDGNTASTNKNYCAYTKVEPQPYITVDLGELKLISSIFISFPNDATVKAAFRAKGQAYVSSDPAIKNQLTCGNFSKYDGKASTFSLVCNQGTSVQGRYVEIILAAATNVALGVCELEIYTEKSVQCLRSGFQGRRCNTACPAGTGGTACTKCPSAVYGSLKLTSTNMCVMPIGGSDFPNINTRLVWTNQCTATAAQFARSGNGALQHVSSGLCIIPENDGSTTPLAGSKLKLSNKCSDDDSVFKYEPVTKQFILDKYWTLCMGPFAKGVPTPNSPVTLALCKPQVGVLSAWTIATNDLTKWQTVINIQANDQRFYYNSPLWTSSNAPYFGSAATPGSNAFLSTYESMKVNALSITLGTKTYNFTLPDDMAGKYSLKDLVVTRKLAFNNPSFLGQKNKYSLVFSGVAQSTYYCGNYGFSQRLFTGVTNDMQCQGLARIGVTTSFKTQYGPIMTWNSRCMSAGSKKPKANVQIKTSASCATADGTNYFYITTDGFLKHSSGMCLTSSRGTVAGGNLVTVACSSKIVKFAYNGGTQTLTTISTKKLCVVPATVNPGLNVVFRLYDASSPNCLNRLQNYLTWGYPPDSANTPCQRNKPLSAEGIGLTTGCLTSRFLASGNLQGQSSLATSRFFSKAIVRVLGVPFCQNNASCNKVLGTCDCPAGWYGATCTLRCPKGSYGLRCQSQCNCKNNATCHPTTGACTCLSGYTGADCSLPCPGGTFGLTCATCACPGTPASNGCDRFTGACFCTAGYAGRNCQYKCNDASGLSSYLNKWGVNCLSKCRCGNNAVCNGITGACACNAGWTGTTCTRSCPTGKYGLACKFSCACMNGAACSPVDGTCTCTAGFVGATCGQVCSTGNCGLNCGSKCLCVNGGCNTQTCGCTSCSAGYRGKLCGTKCLPGKFGLGCSQTCSCFNGATCDNVNGRCSCAAGWSGATCTTRCPANLFGPNCASQCLCGHGKCNPINGNCDCDAGYTGTVCNVLCKDGTFGANCSQSCGCVLNYIDTSAPRTCDAITGACNCRSPYVGICDTVCPAFKWDATCSSTCTCTQANSIGCNQQHGTCDCKPGFQGTTCATACPTGRWGQGCNQYCACNKHGSVCDAVTGDCSCNPGWTGHTCSFACPMGTYGSNCSMACSCGQGTCDVVTGACTCLPGFTGTNCGQACATGFFGLGCTTPCTCVNGTCDDPATGACTCKDGFTGASCDQKCPPGKFGTGCLQVCPNCQNSLGHATGSCLPGDGSCVCSAGYRGALCLDTCSAGWYGLGCAGKCNCSGSPCDTTSGRCLCVAGTTGSQCSAPCPANRYGAGCASVCSCFNGATCDSTTGMCSCGPGFFGQYCTDACKTGQYGAHCLQTCTCASEGLCNPMTGACLCNVGYTGATCAAKLSCPTSKYGPACNLDCQCKNGASCSALDGACTCPAGYQGVLCEEGCPATKYGLGCASDCRCINGDCTPTNGSCSCFNGWSGPICTTGCRDNFWGPGCSTACNCSSGVICDKYNGACLDTSAQTAVTSSSTNIVAIVVPIVVILVLIGLAIVVVVVRSMKKIEKKMPAGMYTADESDVSYAPSDNGEHGMTNPTYASPDTMGDVLIQRGD